MWDKVQKILKSKKGKPVRIYDGEYPLTVTDENQSEISYDVIKEILQSFGRIWVIAQVEKSKRCYFIC